MTAYQIAAANSFGNMMNRYPGFGSATPFASSLGEQRDITGALMGTGLTGQFGLENQRIANEGALERVELTGMWNRKINQDTIEANREADRRQGLLKLLAGGSLFGGGSQQPRFAGAGLSGSPFTSLQNALGGFNNVTGLMNNTYDLTVGSWNQDGNAAVTRALQNAPRPAALN